MGTSQFAFKKLTKNNLVLENRVLQILGTIFCFSKSRDVSSKMDRIISNLRTFPFTDLVL